jgi:hypothetical protein
LAPALNTTTSPNDLGSATISAISADYGIAQAGAAVTTPVMAASVAAPAQCLPASPPAPGCAPFPAMTIGDGGHVATVTKTLFNNGAVPVTVTDTASLAAATLVHLATQVPFGAATCTATPTNGSPLGSQTVTIPAGGTVPLTFTFTVTCTSNSFTVDTDPQFINLTWADSMGAATDPDVVDPTPADHSATASTQVWSKKPFNPAFSAIDSSAEGPSDNVALPTTDNCQENGNALPAGIPCEMVTRGGNGDLTGACNGCEPIRSEVDLLPGGAAGFSVASGLTVPNGDPVGSFGFTIGFNASSCSWNPGPPYSPGIAYPDPSEANGAPLFHDGALPDYTGTTPGSVGPSTLTNAAAQPNEGPNTNTVPSGDGGASLVSTHSWPVQLESDPVVQQLNIADGIPLIAHYVGDLKPYGFAGGSRAVNLLVFFDGSTYYSDVITGDPTDPASQAAASQAAYCTPYYSSGDFFGSDPVTGQTLRQCNSPGTKTAAGSFTNLDTFEVVTVPDAMGCSATATATPTSTPTSTLTPTQSPSPTLAPTQLPLTPASLPKTGGPGDGGGLSTTTLLLMLAFASAVILTAGVSVLTVRYKRNR